MDATCRVAFRVTPAARDALDAAAKRNGRSISDEAREAIERHVGIKPAPRREPLRLPPDPRPVKT